MTLEGSWFHSDLQKMVVYSVSLKKAWMTSDNFNCSVTWVCLQMSSFPTGRAKSIPREHRAREAGFLHVPSWKVSASHCSLWEEGLCHTEHQPLLCPHEGWSLATLCFSLIRTKFLLIMAPSRGQTEGALVLFFQEPTQSHTHQIRSRACHIWPGNFPNAHSPSVNTSKAFRSPRKQWDQVAGFVSSLDDGVPAHSSLRASSVQAMNLCPSPTWLQIDLEPQAIKHRHYP